MLEGVDCSKMRVHFPTLSFSREANFMADISHISPTAARGGVRVARSGSPPKRWQL